MAGNLFRQEALHAQRESQLGDVMVACPLSFSLLTALAVLIGIALVAFISWGEYTHKANVKGYLVPSKGLIKVYPPQEGILIEKQIVEVQIVRQGDTLIVLSTERSSLETPETQAAAIARLKQRRDSLQKELQQQKVIDLIQIRNLHDRILGFEAELKQLDHEIATQRERVTSARKTVTRYQELLTQNFISQIQLQEKRDILLDKQARLQSMQRDRLRLDREIKGLRLEVDTTEMQAVNKRSAITRDISAHEQELTEYESRRNIVITAPSDGVASTVLAVQGQTAKPSIPLLSILPAGTHLKAQLLVPSKAIGFVKNNQSVSLRYEAFPYQRFGLHGGHIEKIAKTLISPGEANLPVTLQEPVYLVTADLDAQSVKAYGNELALQSGMLLEADIQLDRRRIIEWLFDPLFSIKDRL